MAVFVAGNGQQIKQAEQALALHTGTGRLWAVLMQLCNEDGDAAQLLVFEKALQQVPKSGEVWCEGARMCMNLYSKCFDLEAAETYVWFACRPCLVYRTTAWTQLVGVRGRTPGT